MQRGEWEYPIKMSVLISQVEQQIVACKIRRAQVVIAAREENNNVKHAVLIDQKIEVEETLREFQRWLSFLKAMEATRDWNDVDLHLDHEDHSYFFMEI